MPKKPRGTAIYPKLPGGKTTQRTPAARLGLPSAPPPPSASPQRPPTLNSPTSPQRPPRGPREAPPAALLPFPGRRPSPAPRVRLRGPCPAKGRRRRAAAPIAAGQVQTGGEVAACPRYLVVTSTAGAGLCCMAGKGGGSSVRPDRRRPGRRGRVRPSQGPASLPSGWQRAAPPDVCRREAAVQHGGWGRARGGGKENGGAGGKKEPFGP